MGKSKRAKYGQFNTDVNECNFTIEELRKRFDLSGWVLEPSFGSGNFVSELKKSDLSIDCFEIDPEVFSPIDGANCFLGDFLLTDFDKKYDFIIGNPPYIELVYSYYDEDEKSKLRERFNFEKRGRINLVHLFMDKSFELLKDGGVLAYLLPSTILSSPWYNDIRKKIYDEYAVVDIIHQIPFKDVSIDVCLLILQKKFDEGHSFISLKNNYYTLTKNVSNGMTLKEKGFECKIGDTLWYNVKEKLTDDSSQKILLYSNNIGDNEIKIGGKLRSKIPGKKQYIVSDEISKVKDCIVMPRVISKNMKFALIENNDSYLFENHVMVITHENKEMIKELYEMMVGGHISFQDYFNSTNITVNEILNFEY